MVLNGDGTFRRSPHDVDADLKIKHDNWLAQSWKEWPNEAQFEGLEEHRGPIEFTVKGTIPSWAAGSLYRIGPGETTVEGTPRGTHHITHWFDGTAHTHRFDIIPADDADPESPSASARVVYSSRRQGEEIVATIKERGWLSAVSFGQRVDPCIGVFAKVMSVFEPTRSNNNVALILDMPGMPKREGRGGPGDKPKPKPRSGSAVGNGISATTSSSPSSASSASASVSPASSSPSSRGHRARRAANLIATTDSSFLQRLDPETLQPIGQSNQSILHPDLKGQISCAHARFDPETGDLYNFNLELAGRFAVYKMFRVNTATEKTDILATFSGPKYPPTYIHSFFLTENFVVLCLPTAHFSWVGLKIVWLRNFIDAIKPFDEAQPCRWLVIDRRHGRGVVAEFTTPAKFFFHSVNSFEERVEGGADGAVDLFFDVVQYDNTDIMHTMYYDILLDRNDAVKKAMIDKQWYRTTQSSLVRYRYRLDLSSSSSSSPLSSAAAATSSSASPSSPSAPPDATTTTAEEIFRITSPHSGELPTTNPLTATRPYRYVWSLCNRGLSTFMDAIVKTDLHTHEALIWSGPRAHSPGEPIFVARPGGVDEDDGVILSLVLDGRGGTSYLVCLDARTMREMGRAEAGFAIALGLHGTFQRDEEI